MKRKKWILLVVLLVGLLAAGQFLGVFRPRDTGQGQTLTPHAVLAPAGLEEGSGVVASRRYPGVFWLINDSGNEPRLFAVDLEGEAVSDPDGIRVEGARNSDWEDIAIDGESLFIGDVGNNANLRRNLGLYVLKEPDPATVTEANGASFVGFTYPDQKAYPPWSGGWNFDCEALFVSRGKPYLLTKQRPTFRLWVPALSTRLYRLDSLDPSQKHELVLVDEHRDLGGWVTGADMAQDESRLALVIQSPQQAVWVFDRPGDGGDRFLSRGRARRFRFHSAKTVEAVCFENPEAVVVINEERAIFKLKLSDFEEVVR